LPVADHHFENDLQMSFKDQQEHFYRSLASAVAQGESVDSWARSKDVFVEIAREWSERADFPDLVEKCRREHAERMAKQIADTAAKAIDGLAAKPKKGAKSNASLEAVTALVEKWVELAMNLEQMKRLETLEERVKILEEGRAAHVRAMLGNSQN
jgi:hypothetical protein